jgi:MinD-like ATPase involved in chromosome partitioning or flagellar assembly
VGGERVAAAAIAARIRLQRAARRDATRTGALAFDELGGPLVAVCGLTGGAGTSTIALALARLGAAASTAPVLVTEVDPRRAGLAVLAGRVAPYALVELAERVAHDAAPAEAFLELEPGLRLVAGSPRPFTNPEPTIISALLGEARAAHGLVIVDHGTTWTADSPILASATHTLWVVPATPHGVGRAQALFESKVLLPAGRSVEVLVATGRAGRPRVSVRALRRLARVRCERLVLVPCSDAPVHGGAAVDDAMVHAFEGLAPILRSRR